MMICRWSRIARKLPGRTDNEIKNYWRTRVQKQARQLNIESGSKRFIDAVKCFWMPRLLQKMEQNSSPTSQTNMNFGNSSTEASLSSMSSISNSFNIPSISMTPSIDAANHLSTMSSSTNLSSDFFQFSQPLENLENTKSAPNVFENNVYSYPNQESYYIDDTNHYGLNLDPLFSLENYDISQFDYQTEGNGWMLNNNISDTLWNMDAM